MRLMRQVSRRVGDNEYAKWIIIVSPSIVDELGWEEGQELESRAKGRTLIVKPQRERKEKPKKMTYKEFRDKIEGLLKTKPEGLTWTDIRNTLKLPQKVPNNLWVKMMERDIGLSRELNPQIAKKIWRLPTSKYEAPKTMKGGKEEIE